MSLSDAYPELIHKARVLVDHLCGIELPLPLHVHESFRYSCCRQLVIRLFLRGGADRGLRSVTALDLVRTVEADRRLASELQEALGVWVAEYGAFYDDFGGRNAFFIFILKRSMPYQTSETVAAAKESMIDWYESNRSLRLMSARGDLGGAGISPEWLLPILTKVAVSLLARGVIAAGRSALKRIREVATKRFLGLAAERQPQGPSFVPNSYLSLFDLHSDEIEMLVEQWVHSFEAFCVETSDDERRVIDDLLSAEPSSLDITSMKRIDSLMTKNFVRLIEDKPGSVRAVFMPPGFEMIAEDSAQ